MNIYRIRKATTEDHSRILTVAKQSPYTKDFSNQVMFSSEAAYSKGWITIVEFADAFSRKAMGDPVLGFTCVRHKVREPKTVLYFISVERSLRSEGIGRLLIKEIEQSSPHNTIELNVAKENTVALDFYTQLGFNITGEAIRGTAHHLERKHK